MPRVSPEHLAARRRQIVDAARRCFLREGFHRTTMQDVIAEAGLSVGAVYRYFPSKADLISAIAEEAVGGAEAVLDEVRHREPPPPLAEALDRALAYVETQLGDDGVLRIAVQVWGEAQRDRALATLVAGKYDHVRGYLAALVRRAQDTGEVAADADPDAVASAMLALILGWLLQQLLTGRPDRATYIAGVRALLTP
ncbi:TetR/AcrR family transcriptional regulator [Micromonospora citrea]|uniref:TetR/AcrR family transcriptional regulator n=1 Tax=Micromonospora citrea TaxID=47855 RepID=UPI00159F29E7|nr:TetR/AcrR family transcriptional regulator [Micromonospora citrea]